MASSGTFVGRGARRADFHAFSADPQVLATMQEAGLPAPQVDEVGEVHRAKAPALVRSDGADSGTTLCMSGRRERGSGACKGGAP